MSWRISVQQDQNIFEEHVFIFPPQLTNSNFHGTDIYLLSKMGFRGLKLLWVSVLCKAGDIGKLRQICNSRHSSVNMFLKTLLKAYVHKGHKKTVHWHSLFFSKKIFNHETEYVSYHFPIWKTSKGKKFS